jgi:hypothetical protein
MTGALDERDRIRAAMQRILAGTPERSNGALTIVAPAQEADVPRNALTQRHTDLKNQFCQCVKERGGPSEDEKRLRATTENFCNSVPTSPPSCASLTSSRWKTSNSASS